MLTRSFGKRWPGSEDPMLRYWSSDLVGLNDARGAGAQQAGDSEEAPGELTS